MSALTREQELEIREAAIVLRERKWGQTIAKLAEVEFRRGYEEALGAALNAVDEVWGEMEPYSRGERMRVTDLGVAIHALRPAAE